MTDTPLPETDPLPDTNPLPAPEPTPDPNPPRPPLPLPKEERTWEPDTDEGAGR
jgi:hypothetical protein